MKNPLNPLKGWHVLVMILIFFGITIGVNATFITMALRTHPGEDVPRSYMQGLEYNETLENRRIQSELGWTARFNRVENELVLEVLDADALPVTSLDLSGLMTHPTDTSLDCPIRFLESGAGLYRAPVNCGSTGDWRVKIKHEGDIPFEVEYDLWLP